MVSIIIPTYNRANLSARAIRSVLNQTFKDFELIIVDDGSTDNTKDMVEGFCKIDARVKYFRQENSGTPAGPLNNGIKNSQGEYIAFLDDDDEWLPSKLEKQIELFQNSQKPNPGIVSCGCHIIRGDKIKIYKFPATDNILESLLDKSVFLSCSSTVMKNAVFVRLGQFDETFRLFFARDMWLRICREYDFDFVDEPLYRYHIHESNLSRKDPSREAEELGRLIDKWQVLYKKYPAVWSRQLKTVGALYASNGDMASARKYFIASIKAAPYYLKNYINLSISLFGEKMYKKVLSIKNK
jgi:O-antigen biosynthesis protein